MTKRSSIWTFLVASKKGLRWHPFRVKLLAGCKRHLSPGLARSSQVPSEGSIIEQRGRSTRSLVAHRPTLTVGGLDRAVLGFKVSQRPRLGAEALSDRLEGRIRHQGERPVGALLGDDVLASPIGLIYDGTALMQQHVLPMDLKPAFVRQLCASAPVKPPELTGDSRT